MKNAKRDFQVVVTKQDKKFRGRTAEILAAVIHSGKVIYEGDKSLTDLPHGSEVTVWAYDKNVSKRRVILSVPNGDNRTRKVYELQLDDNDNAVAMGYGDFSIINHSCIYVAAILDKGETEKEEVKGTTNTLLDIGRVLSAPLSRASAETHKEPGTDIPKPGYYVHPITRDSYRIVVDKEKALTPDEEAAVMNMMSRRPLRFAGQAMDLVFATVVDIGKVLCRVGSGSCCGVSADGALSTLTSEDVKNKEFVIDKELVVTLTAALYHEERQKEHVVQSHQPVEKKSKEEFSWIPQINQFVKVAGHPEMYVISDYDCVSGDFILTLADSSRRGRSDAVVDIDSGKPAIKKQVMVQGRLLRPVVLKF